MKAWEEGTRPLAPRSRSRIVPMLAAHLATEEGGAWLQARAGE